MSTRFSANLHPDPDAQPLPPTADNLRMLVVALAHHHAAHWGSTDLPATLHRPLAAPNPLQDCEAGLTRMAGLAGWPGALLADQVVQMQAVFDAPQRYLGPLLNQPVTILNTRPWPEHWRTGPALADWTAAAVGPAAWDFVALAERRTLRAIDDGFSAAPALLDDEMLVDVYRDTLATVLGNRFDATGFMAALPAAQVFHTMTCWLPRFDTYFGRLKPSRAIWRTFAKFPPAMITRLGLRPLLDNQAYFAAVFNRFSVAFEQLAM